MARHGFATSLGAFLCLCTAALSQSASSSEDTSSSSSCNSSIFNANASGIYTFPVDYPLGVPDISTGKWENIPDPSWAVTVQGGNGAEIVRNYWYSTAGQNYADDVGINYDVCAFVMGRLPMNAIRLGQSDSGNCSSVLTERCIEGLTAKASSSAHQWIRYSTPPPYVNLTAGVLPSICTYIYNDLRETMGEECGIEFGISPDEPTGSVVTSVQGTSSL